MQQISVLSEEDEIPRRLNRPLRVDAAASTAEEILKDGCDLAQIVSNYEIEIIQAAIGKYGSEREAATALGVDMETLLRKSGR